jgi:hypothetical protein
VFPDCSTNSRSQPKKQKELHEKERLERQAFEKEIKEEIASAVFSIPKRQRQKRTRELLKNDLVVQRLAKVLVLHAFRNPLEGIQAGTWPSSVEGDYSDVKVVSPSGEIPWIRLGRISDEEMKELNIQAVNTLYGALKNLLSGTLWPQLELFEKRDPMPHWYAPEGAEVSEEV